MSEITYISEELVMEGTLDSAGSSVVVAGRFKGELRAKDVLLESNSIFDGNLVADKATLGGLVKGEVSANILNVASSAKVEGNLKTNALLNRLINSIF
jgi:cytoskeletal protein CcmA (bactofilin family)